MKVIIIILIIIIRRRTGKTRSPRMGKLVKGTLSTSVRDHMLVCEHKEVHEDFKFLGNESNRYL